jgi:SAM-dependent methyltransferase
VTRNDSFAMGRELQILTRKHQNVQRDYLARVNDPEWPKWKAAELAKKYGFDYWDGSRKINYGGYEYRPGYWTPVAARLIEEYGLSDSSSVLDVGCGKGFLLLELKQLLPGLQVSGLDVSQYALENAHPDVSEFLQRGSAVQLPWGDKVFDLAFSLNTLHNLYNFELEPALVELSRVSKQQFLCVEAYRSELEKMNLLYWQVTCEAFNTPEEWFWWFRKTGYQGDYEFIYFA